MVSEFVDVDFRQQGSVFADFPRGEAYQLQQTVRPPAKHTDLRTLFGFNDGRGEVGGMQGVRHTHRLLGGTRESRSFPSAQYLLMWAL